MQPPPNPRRPRRPHPGTWPLLALLGCAEPPAYLPAPEDGSSTPATAPGPDDPALFVDPRSTEPTAAAKLVRASMILRGVRPSLDEHARVAADPDALEDLARSWLATEAFAATVRDIHEQAWLIDNAFVLLAASDGVRDVPMATIQRTVWDAPLHEIAAVVVDGRPYTEVVTGQTTVADPVLAEIWSGLTPTGAGETQGWTEHAWTDGRPRAGVLSHSSLWLRYRSAGINYNRGRANALYRALLCEDLLAREVDLTSDVDLADPEATNEAIRSDPACATCHAILDPIASALPFRPQWRADEMDLPFAVYDPAFDDLWATTSEVAPGFVGTPVADLAELGAAIAADPRFVDCAVRRFAGHALQLPPGEVDPALVTELREPFVTSGLDARELALQAALHPDVLAGPWLRATPAQLDRQLTDLVGTPWTATLDEPCCGGRAGSSPYGTFHLLRDRRFGFHMLAGGMDALFDEAPVRTSTPTTRLVLQSMARDAAAGVVARDLSPGAAGRLIVAGPLQVQVEQVHLRVLGEAHPDEVADSLALWERVRDRSGDPDRAWEVVLTALFQDIRLLHY